MAECTEDKEDRVSYSRVFELLYFPFFHSVNGFDGWNGNISVIRIFSKCQIRKWYVFLLVLKSQTEKTDIPK